MNQEQIWRELITLPPHLQQEVFDFISFLRSRYGSPDKAEVPGDLSKEPFIGMWADRTDMEDSNAWVRNLRTQEWG
jgi:hypothetical protein